ncbi:probable alpha-mannosidase At5g13980 [Pistacia vera]|uniref:probable alpha-mannosidase At5g13980 n=1 Tax=Pistacia vera TaxID=55513 RepID=UPI0012633D61|nr:probable alpha-mannosidase At5g13980 [Pistacia vera]
MEEVWFLSVQQGLGQAGIVPGKINVHLVAHSNDDVGWLKTVDSTMLDLINSIQGACVQNVLDSIVPALLADKNRILSEVVDRPERGSPRYREAAHQVRSTRVNKGGMCMHDEAAPHYIDMIDQTTLGPSIYQRRIQFDSKNWLAIDPFGHSAVQAYLLSAEVGFDSLFFARIDYQDRAKRKDEKSLEVVWRASKSLGSSAQIFAGAFPENYEPPSNFYYEINDDSPIIQDNMNLFDYNVPERVNEFVAAAVAQANITRTNHVMWTMGTDFKYQYAHTWFRAMDKFIHYVNQDGRVNAIYSTPSIYTDAKHAANEAWPLKTDDYFPYADRVNAYWTGYFTSRPALKGYVRTMSAYYLAARQLEFFKGKNKAGATTDSLADALALAQHHDAISGTSKQHVASDYAKRLSIGYKEAEEVVSASFACIAESCLKTGRPNPVVTKFQQCPLLNISYCPPSEVDLSTRKNLVVVVYNPLGWKREDVIRIPVYNEKVTVKDSEGKEVESQLLPIQDAYKTLRNYYSVAYLGKSKKEAPNYWLAFSASAPPLGYNTYIISSAKQSAVSSEIKSFYNSETAKNDKIEVGPGNVKLVYSGNEGNLIQYINSRSKVEQSVEQSYSYYYSDNGSADLQASGAYIFRPNGSHPIDPQQQVLLNVLRGPLVDEVHQRINSWIYQVLECLKI